MTDRLIRFSQTLTYLQSRRLYALKYVLNLEKIYDTSYEFRKTQAFDVGNMGHAMLAAKAEGQDMSKVLWDYVAAERLDPQSDGILEAKTAVDRYLQWLVETGTDKNNTIIAAEKRLYLPLGEMHGDNVTLTLEPDLIIRDAFGLLHCRDYKFVTSYTHLGSVIQNNPQGYCYSLGIEHEHGVLPTTFHLHQIHRKPPKRPTTPFVPVSVATSYIDPRAIERYRVQLTTQIAEMVEFHQQIEAGDWSRAYIAPHVGINQTCSFAEICCEGLSKDPAEIADTVKTRYRTKDTAL